MDDVREIGAELHRLAEAEAQDPFDPENLLQLGQRRKRRRRFLSAGGAVAGVAAVALAATLLPGLGSAGDKSQVASAESQESQFSPVPGVPRGEEGADQPVSRAEAVRRCALRYPEGLKLSGGANYRAGREVNFAGKNGVRPSVRACMVPGGDKPSASLIAAAAKDPMPTTTAGQLRNCSVQAWVDMTGWRVMASERYESKRFSKAVLVAVSPSGQKAVTCMLEPRPPVAHWQEGHYLLFFTLDSISKDDPSRLPVKPSARADLFGGGGSKSTVSTWGRVASNAATVRVKLGSGPVHEVPVNDGWFAVAWANPTEAGGDYGVLKAYDKAGKLVRVISQN